MKSKAEKSGTESAELARALVLEQVVNLGVGLAQAGVDLEGGCGHVWWVERLECTESLDDVPTDRLSKAPKVQLIRATIDIYRHKIADQTFFQNIVRVNFILARCTHQWR